MLRIHEKPVSFKTIYELYDEKQHAVYFSYISKKNVFDGFRLHPKTSLSEYLKHTDGTEYWTQNLPEEEHQ